MAKKLSTRALAAIPAAGIKAKAPYARFDVPAHSIDLALAQLMARGKIVRILGEYRRAGTAPSSEASLRVRPKRRKRCIDCGKVLPIARFGRHGGGTPFAVCKHCRGHNISRGNFAYHAQLRGITHA